MHGSGPGPHFARRSHIHSSLQPSPLFSPIGIKFASGCPKRCELHFYAWGDHVLCFDVQEARTLIRRVPMAAWPVLLAAGMLLGLVLTSSSHALLHWLGLAVLATTSGTLCGS